MKNKTSKSILSAVSAAVLFFSCEKVINPELQTVDPVLVVDAWINNKPEKQVIKITTTQTYFDSTLPTGVSGATVTVTDDVGNVYSFVEDPANKGNYQWTPPSGGSFGVINRNYDLAVLLNGETFTSSTVMKRTTAVDSITFALQDSRNRFPDNSYVAEFWGKDQIGLGDAYWIRFYKNGVLMNKPAEISLAFDSGFSSGGDFDGVTFIAPIRRSVNPMDTDPKDDTKLLPPFASGDSLYVEIQSISAEAFDHLTQVKTQTNRNGGFGELFAKPLSNVSTNIANANANGSKVVGFFNVSAVQGRGKKFIK